jgi:hypothetical protein
MLYASFQIFSHIPGTLPGDGFRKTSLPPDVCLPQVELYRYKPFANPAKLSFRLAITPSKRCFSQYFNIKGP